jgi:spermidine synthase
MNKILDAIVGIRTLDVVNSPINGKIIVQTDLAWGPSIKVDGITQSGGVVKSVWKTTLKYIKQLKIVPKNCLIVGLGGGTTAMLIHDIWPSIPIVGVDIDPIMIEMGKKHLGLDTKVEVVISDAMEYAKKEKKHFDLIIVDLYIGTQWPENLLSDEFIGLLKELLTAHGLMVFNMLFYDKKRILAYRFLRKLEKQFATVDPIYPEANVMFLCRKSNIIRI